MHPALGTQAPRVPRHRGYPGSTQAPTSCSCVRQLRVNVVLLSITKPRQVASLAISSHNACALKCSSKQQQQVWSAGKTVPAGLQVALVLGHTTSCPMSNVDDPWLPAQCINGAQTHVFDRSKCVT
jgi:hypothetical protein